MFYNLQKNLDWVKSQKKMLKIFLNLVVTILIWKRIKLALPFSEKVKQNKLNNKIDSNNLNEDILIEEKFYHLTVCSGQEDRNSLTLSLFCYRPISMANNITRQCETCI